MAAVAGNLRRRRSTDVSVIIEKPLYVRSIGHSPKSRRLPLLTSTVTRRHSLDSYTVNATWDPAEDRTGVPSSLSLDP